MHKNFGLQYEIPSARGARGSLAKEGVYASSGKRRGSGSIHRDQQRQPLFASAPPPAPADVRSSSKASFGEWKGNAAGYLKQSIFLPPLSYYAGRGYLLEREEWVPLNGGWHQISVTSSGSFTKLGLHQIVENSCYSPDGAPFVAVYVPPNDEIRDACLERSPYFDLDVEFKIVQSTDPHLSSSLTNSVFRKLRSEIEDENVTTKTVVPSMTVVFGMKSMDEYMFLAGEVKSQTWTLGYSNSSGVTILNQLIDNELRGNVFFRALIQLRGSTLSVDINSVPVFTSVRLPDGITSFGGYPGVVARKGTRYAIKGWRVRGIVSPPERGDPRGGNVVETFSAYDEKRTREREEEEGEEEEYTALEESLVQEPTYIDDVAHRELETEEAWGGYGRGVDPLLVEDEEGEQYYYSPPEKMRFRGDSYDDSKGRGVGAGRPDGPGPAALGLQTDEQSAAVAPKRKAMSLADLMKEKRSQRDNPPSATAATASSSNAVAPTAAEDRHARYAGPNSAYSTPATSSSTHVNHSAPAMGGRQAVFKPRGSELQHRPSRTSGNLSSGTPHAHATAALAKTGYAARMQYGDGGLGAGGGAGGLQCEDVPYAGTGTLPVDPGDDRLAEAARTLLHSHEKAVVDTVMRDVVQHELGVEFSDIAALKEAKRLLSEAVILPLVMPGFFTGIREPWKGVLLFGPPGTGKTLLAKAVCSLNQSSFFSCPSSSLVSKFRGESEKIVRCLFEAARLLSPSVVFLDEVDALVGSRGESGEHEASRRLKTEIFSQMDGIAASNKGASGDADLERGRGRVMVLATTNCPWDLDEAIRRRLEKRIFIPLPDSEARADLFSICLRGIPLSPDVDIAHLASLGEGYSGADIHVVCREAAMMPMRKMLDRVGDPGQLAAMLSPRDKGNNARDGSVAEGGDDPGGDIAGLAGMAAQRVTQSDFIQALKNTRPSVSSGATAKYLKWEMEYGSK